MTDVRLSFYTLASLMTPEYLSFDLNQPTELREKILEEQRRALASAQAKGIDVVNGELTREGHLLDARKRAIREFSKVCMDEGRRCPFELAEIDETLRLFEKKYDLSDPRANMILKGLISQRLTIFRLERYVHTSGSIQRRVNAKTGEEYEMINPAEMLKKSFHESVLNAIVKLDAIFEGQKIRTVSTIDYKTLFDSSEVELEKFEKDTYSSIPIVKKE